MTVDVTGDLSTRSGRLLAGQARVLQSIARGAPLRATLDLLTTTIEGLTEGMRASVLREEEGRLWHGSAPNLPAEYSAAIDGIAIGPVAGSCGTAAYRNQLVVVEDVLVDPLWEPFRDLARTHGFRACWSAPIHASDGAIMGTFALYYDQPRAPQDDDLDLIEAAASLASIALERNRNQRRILASEERFRSLFQASPVGTVLTDRAGVLLEANNAFAKLAGVPADDLLGRAVAELVATDGRSDLVDALRDVGTSGGVRNLEVRLREAGQGRFAHVSLSQLVMEGGAHRCIAVFEDVTERRQLDQLRSRQRELELAAAHGQSLAGLARSAIIINSQRSLSEMLTAITAQACEIIGAHLGSTSLTVPGSGEAEGWPQQGITVQLSDKYADWRGYEAPSAGSPMYGLVCANNDVVRMTDEELKQHPSWRDFGPEAGRHPPMRGWLAAPLVASDGSNLGILQLSDRFEGDFDDNDESIVVQLAQMASIAVEKARLNEVAAQQEQSRLREELLSGLSHDMQTPLATIVALVDTFHDHPDMPDEQRTRALDALARQTDNLYVLVQQFLDYSRLQFDRELHLQGHAVQIATPVRRVLELHQHQRSILLSIDEPSPVVTGDTARLQQVLANLVSNAIKFSNDAVEIVVEVVDDHVAVHVDDRGVGLPDPPEQVFERFFRGPSASGTPGTGLGLYVSRAVMRAMGGDIVGANREGGGARFTMSVPRGEG